nr:hypothetical protein [Tanacetum cinerariifolium]
MTVADEAVNEEMYNSLEKDTTIATSLDAECQDTMGDIIAQTRSENVSNFSNDPPLSRFNTLRSGEDRLKLKELMELCIKLSDKEDASKQGRIFDIDANQDIYLVNVHRDEDILGVNDPDDTSMFDADKDLQGEEVVVEEVITASIATSVTATATTTVFLMNSLWLKHLWK